MSIIEERVLTVEKSSLNNVGVAAAMDRGCTLTKLIYSTEAKEDTTKVRLHFALFKNSDFSSALDHLKSSGITEFKRGAAMRVTGVGCDKYRKEIKEALGIDIQFVNEGLTHGTGLHWFMRYTPREFLFYPSPKLSAAAEAVSKYVKSINAVEIESDTKDADFPCVLLSMGSGAGIFKVEEDGSVKQECSLWFAGTTFLALGKALIGTDSYDQILQLAAEGDRSRVDMQVKDVLANDAESPYGQFPGEVPIYSFGKLVGTGKTAGEFSRADLARSLVHGFANNTMRMLAVAAKAAKVGRLLLGGNFFRHELMRSETMEVANMVVGSQLRVDFIRTGHTGAMGAMLADVE